MASTPDNYPITLFTAPGCGPCQMAKAYLYNLKVDYQLIDLSEHPERQEEVVSMTGQLGVPVIAFHPLKEFVVGFNKDVVDDCLDRMNRLADN